MPPWDVDIDDQEDVLGTAIAMDRVVKAILAFSGVAAAGVAVPGRSRGGLAAARAGAAGSARTALSRA
ncbi:MAG: hypothetical protein V4437_00570, partial [Patescibacteria group bacterium]